MAYDPFAPADPVVKFPTVGTVVTMVTRDVYQALQARDTKGNKKFFQSGDPVMEYIVPVTVDGEAMRLWAGSGKLKALKEAVKNAPGWRGGLGPDSIGSTITMKRLPDSAPSQGVVQGAHNFVATFTPPTVAAVSAAQRPGGVHDAPEQEEAPPF